MKFSCISCLLATTATFALCSVVHETKTTRQEPVDGEDPDPDVQMKRNFIKQVTQLNIVSPHFYAIFMSF